MRSAKTIMTLVLAGVTLFAACGEKADTDSGATETQTTATVNKTKYFNTEGVSAELSDSIYVIAGISFQKPKDWRDEGSTSMRKAQLAYGPIEDDVDSATMVLYYFGDGEGGPVQANLDRWISQVPQADGSSSADKAIQSEFDAGGMKGHVVEVPGAYNAGGMSMGSTVAKTDYLLVGIVLEGPQGNLFFKLTGPKKTAAKMAGQMAVMFESVKKTE